MPSPSMKGGRALKKSFSAGHDKDMNVSHGDRDLLNHMSVPVDTLAEETTSPNRSHVVSAREQQVLESLRHRRASSLNPRQRPVDIARRRTIDVPTFTPDGDCITMTMIEATTSIESQAND